MISPAFFLGEILILDAFLVAEITYPLVMTNSSPWKDPPFFIGKPGKPSISIRAIEKPWRTVSHNQRVNLHIFHGKMFKSQRLDPAWSQPPPATP